MFSHSEIRSTSLGFGRFVLQLAGLGVFGFVVWAALYAAASWEHDQRHLPGIVAAADTTHP
jgi:hypothetical protein